MNTWHLADNGRRFDMLDGDGWKVGVIERQGVKPPAWWMATARGRKLGVFLGIDAAMLAVGRALAARRQAA